MAATRLIDGYGVLAGDIAQEVHEQVGLVETSIDQRMDKERTVFQYEGNRRAINLESLQALAGITFLVGVTAAQIELVVGVENKLQRERWAASLESNLSQERTGQA